MSARHSGASRDTGPDNQHQTNPGTPSYRPFFLLLDFLFWMSFSFLGSGCDSHLELVPGIYHLYVQPLIAPCAINPEATL